MPDRVERVQALRDLALDRRQGLCEHAALAGTGEGVPGVAARLLRLHGVANEEAQAPGRARPRLPEGPLPLGQQDHGVLLAARKDHDAHAQHQQHGQKADERDRHAPLRLAARHGGLHPARAGAAAGHPVQHAVPGARERATHRPGTALEGAGRGARGAHHRIATGNGAAWQVSVRVHHARLRDRPALRAGRRDLRRLQRHHRIRAVPAGGHEQVVEMLHGRLGVERHDRVLELLRAHGLGQVAADQEQRVAHRQLAPPHVHAQRVICGNPGQLRLVGHQQARGPHEVRLRVTDRGHVQLALAHDRDGDAQDAWRHPVALAAAAQLAVGSAHGLLEADGDTRGLVVVVLAADRVGDHRGRLASAAADLAGDHHEVHVPLGAALGAGHRLLDQHRVGRGRDPVRFRDQAELQLEACTHAGESTRGCPDGLPAASGAASISGSRCWVRPALATPATPVAAAGRRPAARACGHLLGRSRTP